MIQTFKLHIETGNDAAQTRIGINELLRAATERIFSGSDSGTIYDRNGNAVGSWEITQEDEDDKEEQP